MSIFSGVKAMFGKKATDPQVTLETLANLPLYNLLDEGAPFSDWRSPDAEIPAGLDDSFKVYVWMYQMYMFYGLTEKRFGHEVAEKVLRLQTERLNQAPGDLGKQLEVAINKIRKNINEQVNKPHVVEIGDENVEIPIEYGIALEFLVLTRGGPFYVDSESCSAGEVPEMRGADFALAQCLEHGKHSANSYFQQIYEVVNVVL